MDSTGYRLYTMNSKNGKLFKLLVSWRDRNCKHCKRYLSKHDRIYCKSCSKKVDDEYWKYIRNEVYNYSRRAIREAIGILLPSYLRDELRSYM